MDQAAKSTIDSVRARVTPKTLIQDLSDPLTGSLDNRRIAAKFNNLEGAIGDLADAVETIASHAGGSATAD
jgi:hypothetical protein